MKKFLRIARFVLVIAFLGIQVLRPAKNVGVSEGEKSLAELYQAPLSVRESMRAACYDCHSNNTSYPWYSSVQPVGWWMASHVNSGRRHLNLSDFGSYPAKKAAHKLDECVETLEARYMPLSSYTLLHPRAKLSEEKRKELIAWLKATRDKIDAGGK